MAAAANSWLAAGAQPDWPDDGQAQAARASLVDRLVDSQLDWRQLVSEANGLRCVAEQLGARQLKRQEIIHELVRTERHHCLTLALMRQVYLGGLARLNESRLVAAAREQPPGDPLDLERLFPALDELIQAHELFFAHLRLRLVESCQPRAGRLVGLVGPLGGLLASQFRLGAPRDSRGGAAAGRAAGAGDKLLQAYAKFCGQHADSSRYYKQLMQHDKHFKQFIQHCTERHAACRNRGIPECNLLVTQRLTKYPLLIEQLIKCSKDEPDDEEAKLREALAECRALLAELNGQLARKESFERLLDIYAHFSPKSHTIFHRGRANRFTKHDLLQHRRLRRLCHLDDRARMWSASRRKLLRIVCLVLDDIVVFLRVEPAPASDGATGTPRHLDASEPTHTEPGPAASPQQAPPQPRYQFANIDNKSSVISLDKLLIRDKAVEEAEPRLYLISSSSRQPEMYELAFESRRHQASFVDKLKASVEQHNRLRRTRDSSWRLRWRQLVAAAAPGAREQPESPAAPSDCEDLDPMEARELSLLAELGRRQAHHEASLDHDAPSDLDEGHPEALLSETEPRPQAGSGSSSSRQRPGGSDLEQLELDIEQELVLGPAPGQTSDGEPASSARSSCGSSSPGADHARAQLEPQAEAPSLSERARDSCDDSSPTKHRLKASQRRRRAQRPRQVSNQSSGSSGCESMLAAAEHRRALEQLAAASADQPSADGRAAAGCPVVGLANEDEFDSGRGQDDTSSSASSSSAPTRRPGAGSLEQLAPSANGSPSSSCKSALSLVAGLRMSSSPSLGSYRARLRQKNKQPLAAPTSHERKLSTVSSVSSQLSLFAKLRANLNSASSSSRRTEPAASGCWCPGAGRPSHPDEAPRPAPNKGPSDAHESATRACHCCCCSSQARLISGHLLRRRSTFVPEQKLEQLRDLKLQLDRDKEEWFKKFNRMQEQLLDERRHLDMARDQLKLERQQVADEREQLYRKLDVLKENGILLSPSHKVIIKSPAASLFVNGHQGGPQQQASDHQRPSCTSVAINCEQSSAGPEQRRAPALCNQFNGGSSDPQPQRGFATDSSFGLFQSSAIRLHISAPHQQLAGQTVPTHLGPAPSQQSISRMPFIGAIPGAHFWVERFGVTL